MTKLLAALLACAGVMVAAEAGVAGGLPPRAGGLLHPIAHKHVHVNGHTLLGDKLKQDGKHDVGKVKDSTVTAEVTGGKVTNMTAGSLKVIRMKSSNKMAWLDRPTSPASRDPMIQKAQYDQTYYAYCVDDGYTLTCYWYPESDVAYADYAWVTYTPDY